MQPTTMTDIKEMQNNGLDTTFNVDEAPESLDEVTTAPQDQLDKLNSEIPKQSTSNHRDI